MKMILRITILALLSSSSYAYAENSPLLAQNQATVQTSSVAQRAPGYGNLEDTWYRNHGSREYWNNRRNLKQIWVNSDNFVDPASVPNLNATAGGAKVKKQRQDGNNAKRNRIGKKAQTAKKNQNPCPPGYICVPAAQTSSPKLTVPTPAPVSAIPALTANPREQATVPGAGQKAKTNSSPTLTPDKVNTPLQ